MRWLLLLVALCSVPFIAQTAHAQQSPQLSVSPSIMRLDLSSDKPEAPLTYTNLTNQPMELSFQAQDFKELENGYQLSFLEGKDADNYKYGLSSWIQFSSKTLLLAPHQSAAITVFVEKDKLSPGGHYATILAQVNPQQGNTQQIQVKGVLGSLLFVRTNTGTERESATLPSFELTRNLFDFPDTVYFRFNNTGDTDLVPYGLVQIYYGKTLVAKGIVNDVSAPTLPQSIRRYYVSEKNMQPFLLPGIYSATISLHFGEHQQKLTKTITFFSLGSIPLIPIGVVLLLIGGILYMKRRRSKNLE